MKHFLRICARLSAVLTLLCSYSASAAVVSVDPDAFFTGTDISEAYPGVTLSVIGAQVDEGITSPSVFSLVGVSATTGLNLFASSGSQGWTEDVLVMRVDFDKPAKSFSVDVIGRNGEIGVVRAFNDAGMEVDSYTTEPLRPENSLPGAAFAFEVASISPAKDTISYVLIYAIRESGSVRLDNIRYESEPDVAITFGGGSEQECSEVGGASVEVQADLAVEGESLGAIEWQVDGISVAFENPASLFVPLGTSTISAIVTAASGNVFSASEQLVVADTTPPSVDLSLTDRLGREIGVPLRAGLNTFNVNYSATDVCDPKPEVSGMAGTIVANGQQIRVQTSVQQVIIDSPGFTVRVEAMDASGNRATREVVLQSP